MWKRIHWRKVMLSSGVKVPMSRIFRDRAEGCRTMAELFRSEKAREHLLKVAADYESMANQEATFELEDANEAAGSHYFHFASRLIFGRP
jgi:hypothetical protein